MGNFKKIILGMFFSSLSLSLALADLSDGMNLNLPLSHVADNKYLSFENHRAQPRAPIAGSIEVNGERVRSLEEISAVFAEEVAAFLPEGTSIKEATNSEEKLVWRYPIGTRVVHQIHFKDNKKTLFELRMIERVSDSRWAYGIYQGKNQELELRRSGGTALEEYSLTTIDNKPLHIKLQHIPLQICQNCHANTTSAPYQYTGLQDVGPCEFTPANPKVKVDWVRNYSEKFGRTPVTN